MRAKDFFHQVEIAAQELKDLKAIQKRFEDLGISMGSGTVTLGNKSRGTSRVELAACGAVDTEMDLEQQKREYLAIIAHAQRIIRQIPQEKYRRLLKYKYICGKSYKWVSDELDYRNPNSIYRANGWALREAQKILNREEK